MDARELGATPDEIQEYGSVLSIWEALRLLQAWAPLVNYARAFVAEIDPYRKSLIVADACEWLAQQTSVQVDNQLVRYVSDLLRTKEGEAFVRFCLFQVGVK